MGTYDPSNLGNVAPCYTDIRKAKRQRAQTDYKYKHDLNYAMPSDFKPKIVDEEIEEKVNCYTLPANDEGRVISW